VRSPGAGQSLEGALRLREVSGLELAPRGLVFPVVGDGARRGGLALDRSSPRPRVDRGEAEDGAASASPRSTTVPTGSCSTSGTPRSVTRTASRSLGWVRTKKTLMPIINTATAAIASCGRMA
jgi:hypothetical protein